MEADLDRFYGIDYRDRWRFDSEGRRILPLRRLWVRFKHLPPESACADLARGGKPHWSIEAHLLDQLRMAMTGSKKNPAKPHPQRPTGKPRRKYDPDRPRKIAAAKRRAAERRERLAT